jgi:hypothetical protein
VAEIAVKKGARFNGGSATLIAVSETQGLLLTCQHVVLAKDKEVFIRYRNGTKSRGKVYSLAPNGLDAALVICPRPEGINPVPVVQPSSNSGQTIINCGYPGNDHVLRWQRGTTTSQNSVELRYDVRPIPGMSGGATFDEYGNLIAVVQFYNRRGGGSTGGSGLRSYLAAFIKSNAKVAWGGPPGPNESEFELVAEGSMQDAPDEFSDWALWTWNEFETGPIKNFLEYLKQPTPFPADQDYHVPAVVMVPTPYEKPPVVIETPRVHIGIHSHYDLEIEITRPPRRTKNNCRRFRILRRRR